MLVKEIVEVNAKMSMTLIHRHPIMDSLFIDLRANF
jgi:hypothetical protein